MCLALPELTDKVVSVYLANPIKTTLNIRLQTQNLMKDQKKISVLHLQKLQLVMTYSVSSSANYLTLG
jgi:hypothetical protein